MPALVLVCRRRKWPYDERLQRDFAAILGHEHGRRAQRVIPKGGTLAGIAKRNAKAAVGELDLAGLRVAGLGDLDEEGTRQVVLADPARAGLPGKALVGGAANLAVAVLLVDQRDRRVEQLL